MVLTAIAQYQSIKGKSQRQVYNCTSLAVGHLDIIHCGFQKVCDVIYMK